MIAAPGRMGRWPVEDFSRAAAVPIGQGDMRHMRGTESEMSYHEFLAYLFDRAETRHLAIAFAEAVEELRREQAAA